jgi:hypothetical protein
MHFLRKDELSCPRELGKARAAVRVKVDGTRLVMTAVDAIVVAKRDALFVPLPERIRVIGPDGKAIKPSRGARFWITVETLDPYHLVTESAELPIE